MACNVVTEVACHHISHDLLVSGNLQTMRTLKEMTLHKAVDIRRWRSVIGFIQLQNNEAEMKCLDMISITYCSVKSNTQKSIAYYTS